MKKIKTSEKEIIKSLKAKNPYTKKVFQAMALCLYVYDNIYHTNHVKNIKNIYGKYANESITKISNCLNTGERTLLRYRHHYLKCFETCEFAIKYFEQIFDFIK